MVPITCDLLIETVGIENQYLITWISQGLKVSFKQSIDLTDEDIRWLWQLPLHRRIIGEKLFHFLDGEKKCFQKLLEQAGRSADPLQIKLYSCPGTHDWPFEILFFNGTFLFAKDEPHHLVRCVKNNTQGDRTEAKPPQNRPLKMLFMACSVMDNPPKPELDFEREEEAIFDITGTLPMEMDVEDSGSLIGLQGKLEQEEYDVLHLSGHAGIDKKGKTFFIMEEETGGEHRVFPHQLLSKKTGTRMPHLIVLSGNSTSETPGNVDMSLNEAESSFARILVEKYNVPAVLGWGRKVDDGQAIYAGKILFKDLSRGESLLDAVWRTRVQLSKEFKQSKKPAWPLLRLYSNSALLHAIVKREQQKQTKPRRMTHAYLRNSRVKILNEGFVGRRRQLQKSLSGLKKEIGTIGLLIMGTGGLGKSCLAGKICERFSDHVLIIVKGRLNTVSLADALKDAFIAAQDDQGKKILAQRIEMTDKLIHLCSTCFKKNKYLFILDDFEQNLEGFETGEPGELFPEAADLLSVLLQYLSLDEKRKTSQMIITCRYDFALQHRDADIIGNRLKKIWLAGFHKTEMHKKEQSLTHIRDYIEKEIARRFLYSGCGNPRLMEWLDVLLGELKGDEAEQMVSAIANEQEAFIEEHVIRNLLKKGGVPLTRFLRWFSIYRIPVCEEGVLRVVKKARLNNWQNLLQRGMALSLIEHDQVRKTFQVTPLLREELLKGLRGVKTSHKAAFTYFKKRCQNRESLDPILAEEWVYHALGIGEENVASRQAGCLVNYLRKMLAFHESRRVGFWVLDEKKKKKVLLCTEHDAFFLNEVAHTIDDLCEHRNALNYYKKALEIDLSLFGEKHPNVAIRLSNMGEAWRLLGEAKKAIGFYVQALVIDREQFGDRHPHVAERLHNIGSAWYALDDFNQAIGYYEQAHDIWQCAYGENHQKVATAMINLGEAWRMLGDAKKAIQYYKQALVVFRGIYGEEHLAVADVLKSLGIIFDDLGEFHQAIDYVEQAHLIHQSILGENHPDVAIDLNSLAVAWQALGEFEKAVNYQKQALSIWKNIYGEKHSNVAAGLNNLGRVYHITGDLEKAIKNYEDALNISESIYGENHSTVANRINNLGLAWQELGEFKKAIEHFERALSIWKEVFGEKHSTVATVTNNLGLAWYNLGENKKAVTFFKEALKIGEKVYGEHHYQLATGMNNLGLTWKALGKPKEAIVCYEKALSIFKKTFGDNHHHVATTLNNLGEAWKISGDASKAIKYYEQALAIDKNTFGENHASIAVRLNNLGAAWQVLEDFEKAIRYHQQALDIDKDVFAEPHPNQAYDLSNLGTAHFKLSQKEKAKGYFEEAYAIFLKFYGNEHPHTKTAKDWLEVCLYLLKEEQGRNNKNECVKVKDDDYCE